MKALLFPLLLASLFFAACAKQPSMQPADPAKANARWQTYLASSEKKAEPYSIGMSMRFGKEGDTRRVTALFWGNGREGVRLDVMAGVGALVAQISQADGQFLLHAPLENKAYFYEGPKSPLLKAGVPLPLTLPGLESLLCGRSAEVFGQSFSRADSVPEDGIAYQTSAGIGGTLTLNPQGQPVAWKNDTWTMRLTPGADGLPERADIASKTGDRGIILVKERNRAERYAKDKMTIRIPDSTPLLPIEEATRRR